MPFEAAADVVPLDRRARDTARHEQFGSLGRRQLVEVQRAQAPPKVGGEISEREAAREHDQALPTEARGAVQKHSQVVVEELAVADGTRDVPGVLPARR